MLYRQHHTISVEREDGGGFFAFLSYVNILFPLCICAGPATVRMVSSNGPPVPMPMQVPPGHMVQQIVDEHGILTHVILSPQPPMPGAPMTVGYYVCICPLSFSSTQKQLVSDSS